MALRFRRSRSHKFVCVTAVAFASAAAPAIAQAPQAPAAGLSVTAPAKMVSGTMVPVRIKLTNRSRLPLRLNGSRGLELPELSFSLAGASRGPAGGVARSWRGLKFAKESHIPLSTPLIGPSDPHLWLGPGRSTAWATLPLGRYYDLTLPGRYRLVLTTLHRLYLVEGEPKVYKVTQCKYPAVIYWMPSEWWRPGRGSALGRRLPPVMSQLTRITVLAPYRKPPSAALAPAGAPGIRIAPPGGPGLTLLLADPDVKGPGPITVRAFLEHNGHGPMALRLTGDPQLDFRAVQIHEPGWYVRGTRVLLPKPHWVFPKLPPPLTAYGRWLLKHPPKKLPEKNYTLKPGVVYQYAVPINLSCQYEMSLAGVYRVRVELTHPEIWSNWIKVKVPQ